MKRHPSTHGSALLMVLWAIALMAICVLGLAKYLYGDLDETTALKKDSRARQLALSGVAIGLHPLVARADPVLKETIAPGEGFEAHLRSEGGRLNINTVLQNGEWNVLQNLFNEWGVQQSDIDNLITGFKARVQQMAPGAPAPAAPPAPSGTSALPPPPTNLPPLVQLFDSVDEMLNVPGMDVLTQVKPDWRDYFTIWSDGPLDMNDAPADLIAAVCNVGMEQAQQFVSARTGPDGVPDTDDDIIFTSLDQVRVQLGMSLQEFATIQGLLSVQDSTTRIESTGSLGTYQRKITVVVRKNVTPPLYFLWQEF